MNIKDAIKRYTQTDKSGNQNMPGVDIELLEEMDKKGWLLRTITTGIGPKGTKGYNYVFYKVRDIDGKPSLTRSIFRERKRSVITLF
jgi:hypothetical protein